MNVLGSPHQEGILEMLVEISFGEEIKCSLKKMTRQPIPTIHASPNKTKTLVVNVTKPHGRQLHDPNP